MYHKNEEPLLWKYCPDAKPEPEEDLISLKGSKPVPKPPWIDWSDKEDKNARTNPERKDQSTSPTA